MTYFVSNAALKLNSINIPTPNMKLPDSHNSHCNIYAVDFDLNINFLLAALAENIKQYQRSSVC